MNPITTIYFDMGGTLLHYHPPDGDWHDMESLGAAGIYSCLTDLGYTLPPRDEAIDDWWQITSTAWRSLRDIPKEQVRPAALLRQLAEKWQLNLPDETLAAVERAYVAGIQKIVQPLEGALEAVRWVKAQGLNVGLISNTVWQGKHHQEDLERHGFWEYFAHTIFSSDALAWKPEEVIFQQGLSAFGARPDEAVYVGDSLFFDIYGAQQAGWRAVWVEQAQLWMPPTMEPPTPDATLAHMSDLPKILADWL